MAEGGSGSFLLYLGVMGPQPADAYHTRSLRQTSI